MSLRVSAGWSSAGEPAFGDGARRIADRIAGEQLLTSPVAEVEEMLAAT